MHHKQVGKDSYRPIRPLAAYLLALAIGSGGLLSTFPNIAAADEPSATAAPSADQTPAQKATAAISQAAVVLSKEYAAFEQDPAAHALRAHSDYFSTTPSPDVTEEAVVHALDRSLGYSPRVEMYIKWQLLSAVPGKFDDQYAQPLAEIFLQHPALQARPGTTPASKNELEQSVRRSGVNQIGRINEDFDKMVAATATENQPILRFGDDLFLKLPVSPATLRAGFEEAVTRARLGIDSSLSVAAVGAARSWASGGPPAEQLAEMRKMVHELVRLMGGPTPKKAADADSPPWTGHNANIMTVAYRYSGSSGNSTASAASSQNHYPATFPPDYFTGVSWKKNALVWSIAKVKFADKKQIEELESILNDAITNPNAGLKFNDGN